MNRTGRFFWFHVAKTEFQRDKRSRPLDAQELYPLNQPKLDPADQQGCVCLLFASASTARNKHLGRFLYSAREQYF